jgi:hypothetical protein
MHYCCMDICRVNRERVRRYEEIGTFWSERGAGKTAADEQRRMEVYTHFI